MTRRLAQLTLSGPHIRLFEAAQTPVPVPHLEAQLASQYHTGAFCL